MNDQKFFLETERLYLNVPKITNLDNWYNLQCNNEVVKYISNGKPLDKSQIKKSLYKIIEHYKEYKYSFFNICLKNNNFIGIAGLSHLEYNEKNKYIEVGFVLDKKYWGKGYATESVKKLIDYGLNQIKLKNIYACCHVDNHLSKNVIKKCGMKYVKKYKYKGVVNCDLYMIQF